MSNNGNSNGITSAISDAVETVSHTTSAAVAYVTNAARKAGNAVAKSPGWTNAIHVSSDSS